MDIVEIKEMVKKELDSAIEKWPKWVEFPHDEGVVLEELGEFLRAIQRYVYEDKSIDDVYSECIQTIAMLFRKKVNGDNEKVFYQLEKFCMDYSVVSYENMDIVHSSIEIFKDITCSISTTDVDIFISDLMQFMIDIKKMVKERKYIEN